MSLVTTYKKNVILRTDVLEVQMILKKKDYFATRYSLIPDLQLDFASNQGITKEKKFMNWLLSFEKEKKKEVFYRAKNYTLYCKQVSINCFFMSFAKELQETIGQKTDDGIQDTLINNYKKCNIIIQTDNQWMLIEKNLNISNGIESQKNLIANVISKALDGQSLYFELGIMTEKNNFWKYVMTNKNCLTDIDITLSSPNFLSGVTSVSDFLHQMQDSYNNTSVKVHLKNEKGHLIINPDNVFLQDVVRYASAGCGTWKMKTTTDKTGCSSSDNPYIIPLPDDISQLKDSDQKYITSAIEHMKQIDSECKKE